MFKRLVCLLIVASQLPFLALGAPRVSDDDKTVYRLQSDDQLNITVVDQPSLTMTITVLPDGTISYPYLGSLKVLGMPVKTLQSKIFDALNKQLVDPVVTVSVAKHRDKVVSGLGALKTPGMQSLQPGWRVLDLLAACGGLSVERPEWTDAKLIRADGKPLPLDLPRMLANSEDPSNVPLVQGDVLVVNQVDASRTHVQILGEVQNQGAVLVPSDGSISTAIGLAGGVTPKAALSRATILREGKVINVDLRPISTGQPIVGATVQAGDTLVIPTNKQWFAVFGTTKTPGVFDMPDDEKLTVLTALAKAGGPTTDSDLIRVRLVRKDASGNPVATMISVDKLLKDGKGNDIPMESGDILYVPQHGKSVFSLQSLVQIATLGTIFGRKF